MPENSLLVRLDAVVDRSGEFMLTCNSSRYSVTLHPERSQTFSDLLRRLRAVVIGQDDPSGQLAPLALLPEVGIWLWQALLPDTAPAQERDALSQALRDGLVPLLLALSDTLAGLPWELLYDPHYNDEQGFLSQRRPLLRFIPTETNLPSLPLPLRVLVLLCSPLSLGEFSRVDVESERAAIEQATREAREAGLLHLLVEDFVTPERVQQALVKFKPHLLHYIGHGGYHETMGGVLLWENESGQELPFTDVRLARLLRPRGVRAVVLHACETGRRDERVHVHGVAGTLVREGIPAVLAQQASFSYESSQRASRDWYTALTSGQGLAEALFEVRQGLALSDRPDWAVPVLYGSTVSLLPLLDESAPPGPPIRCLPPTRELLIFPLP